MSRVICDVMFSERCTLLSNNVRDVYGICQIHKRSAAKERLYVLRRMCCVLIAGQPGWSRPLSPPPHRCSRHKSSRRRRRRGASGVSPLISPRPQVGSLFLSRTRWRALALWQSTLAGAEGEFVQSPNRVSPVLNRAYRRVGAARVSARRSIGTGQTRPSTRYRTPSAGPYTRLESAPQRRVAPPQPK